MQRRGVASCVVLVLALVLVSDVGVRAAAPAFSQVTLTTRSLTVFTHAHASAGEQYTQHHYSLALLTAHANQPLYVKLPSSQPQSQPQQAPAAGAGAGATSTSTSATAAASGSTAAWEDLWPISDLRAELEHAFDHPHTPHATVERQRQQQQQQQQQQLVLSLAEVRCGRGASAVRYPFAPFSAAPSDSAPFFPPRDAVDTDALDAAHATYGALPVPLPQSSWLPLVTRVPEPGLERALDVDWGSNNLYAVLFVTAYERHNSTAAAAAAAGAGAAGAGVGASDVRRVQFGPAIEELAECALVINPTRRAGAGTAAAAAAAADAKTPNVSVSNFAQQHVPANTRLELQHAARHHVLQPTHLFALHDDVVPPHARAHATATEHPVASGTGGDGDDLFDGEPLPPTLDAAASFLPPQFVASRHADAHNATRHVDVQHLRARADGDACAAAIEEGRNAFIETGTGQLAGILTPVLTAMAEPFIDQFNDLVTSWVMLDLEQNFVHGMLGGIPPLVAEPLTFILKRNITNLVTDAVTHGVTQRLAPTIANYIAPFLTATIANDVVPRVARGVHRAIADTVPHRLQYSIPKALARAIPVITTYRTVMGVTHSLVPTLTRILSHTSNSERFCYYCQHYQQHCGDCHYININSFNIQFYSGFYSDYFGAYYADYYAQATKDLQYKLHDIKGEPYTEEDTEQTTLNPPPDDD